nr:hypothetical protein BaRGS_026258 [Batillaria attramentaria]
MVRGQWVPRQNVSAREMHEMDKYLERLRGEYNLPATLQRPDGACDNIGFKLSEWKPEVPGCHVHEFGAKEACDLLKGTTLVLAGDSFIRHVFVALVMLLTHNFRDGALKKDADPDVRKHCTGMYQINGIKCRALLEQNRTLCDGTVQARYIEIFSMWQGRFLLPEIQKMTSRGERVMLVTGIGIHDDFLTHIIWAIFVQPLVEYVAQTDTENLTHFNLRRWPKLIWANSHAPNLLKSPYVSPRQTFESVLRYNSEMTDHLRPYGVPVLDTFNMTAPLHSVDGTHYGYGANTLKVQFLLNWVQERQQRNEW